MAATGRRRCRDPVVGLLTCASLAMSVTLPTCRVMSDDAAFDDRFVLFSDFLGSSDAATNWPRHRKHELVDLLKSIALSKTTEMITGGSQEDGNYRLLVTPEISTFSDNVVVSWSAVPEEVPYEVFASMWAEIVCKDAIRVLGAVAELGLRIGILVRGGLSFGEMFHQDGVVFGEAMVDAARLEKPIAINPRVVVSERVLAKITQKRPEERESLLQDADGLWHLDYFAQMMRNAAPRRDDAIDPVERLSPTYHALLEADLASASRWRHAHLDRIEQEIEALRKTGATTQAAKWEWFKERFVEATWRIP
jgi:hypothetical protein